MNASRRHSFGHVALFILLSSVLTLFPLASGVAEDPSDDMQEQELMEAKEALRSMEGYLSEDASMPAYTSRSRKSFTQAEAFVAGPDWEFDGFVAGGQDSAIKSMFVLNDLVYLNIGLLQGVEPGDRFSVFRRGQKVRDPQTGRFLGYEVRRAAVTEVTNKVGDEACAARVVKTFEGVEIGDLVRRD